MAAQMMLSFTRENENIPVEILKMAQDESGKIGYKITTGQIVSKIFKEWKELKSKNP